MVAIMWLTGGKKPQTPAKARPPPRPQQAPLEVNETKIAELQNRIQELQRQQLRRPERPRAADPLARG